MIRAFALAVLLATPVPAAAQNGDGTGDGFAELMGRMEDILRGFLSDMEPQMRQLEKDLSQLEPELRGFLEQMRDMVQYHPPEVLPNGDILIRRRDPDQTPPDKDAPPAPDAGGADAPPLEL